MFGMESSGIKSEVTFRFTFSERTIHIMNCTFRDELQVPAWFKMLREMAKVRNDRTGNYECNRQDDSCSAEERGSL